MLKKNIQNYLQRTQLNHYVHVTSQTNKWNKFLNAYFFGIRYKNLFFNLTKTNLFLKRIFFFFKKSIIKHHSILFVGLHSHVKPFIRYLAENLYQPYVSQNWIGGNLTNWRVIQNYISRLIQKSLIEDTKKAYGLKTKSFFFQKLKQYFRIRQKIKGLEYYKALPNLLVTFQYAYNFEALREAHSLRIPTICLLSGQDNYSRISYPIFGNNKSLESLNFYSNFILNSVKSGFLDRRISFLKLKYIYPLLLKPRLEAQIGDKLNLFNHCLQQYNQIFIKKTIRKLQILKKLEKKKTSIF